MFERTPAVKLLLKYWGGRPIPVDPIEIAQGEGVTVRAALADDNLNGASGWYRLIDGKPTILYNDTENSNRRRFTIAHELGHHALEHGERPRDTRATMVDPYDTIEKSANRFAAELLMPAFAVKTLVDHTKGASIKDMALAFQVSEISMQIRLKNLGYLR